MVNRMQLARLLFAFVLLIGTACAQTVRWTDAGTGDPADLQLVFTDCAPEGEPGLPALTGATLNFAGRSEQTSIINFSITRSVVLTYRLQIRQPGAFTIPEFKIKTNKGDLTVPAYTTGQVRPGPEADVTARLKPRSDTVWAGEVFPLTYSIDVARRSFSNFGGGVEWDPVPLLTEDWSKPEAVETTRNGEVRLNLMFNTRAYAKSPGTLRLNPVNQLLNLAIGTVGFGIFQQQRIEQVAASTNRPELRVKPLPLPAPADFTGAVGQFRLNAKVVPATAAVGEPVTWTLELTGTGNWPEITGLPGRSVSKDFQVIQPQARRTVAEGKLFEGTLTEDVVLIPTKPGTYTLGGTQLSVFNPATGAYETLRTPAATVTITAAEAPRFNVTPADSTAVATPTAPEIAPPPPPADPMGLPRDPLAGSGFAPVPFANRAVLLAACLAPFGLLVLGWLTLAAVRAARLDPHRPRRAARRKLTEILVQLRSAKNATSPVLLQAWQRETARLWSLPQAAPRAHALPDHAWQTLWQEAERAIYGAKPDLPSDWTALAEAALAASKVPGSAWHQFYLPRHLLPFLILCAIGFVLPASSHADPAAVYREGRFDQAGQGWREAVTNRPTDWIARHNLALALAQQERWPEAAAHATAAWLQHPRDEAARWNLALTCTRAGYTPTAIAPLLENHPRARLAGLASPAEWERVLVTGTGLIALALFVWLLVAYQHLPRGTRWAAWTGLALGLLLMLLGGIGRSAYGIAAHPQAALVWRGGTLHSIPTEAETAQQTTPLPAGAMGAVDKTFLGWSRLNFPNGQTGWVRQEEIMPLWR